MKAFKRTLGGAHSHTVMALLALASTIALTFAASSALGAQAPVPLGNAQSFAVLSATGVTNVGASTINDGDIGSSLAIGGGITVNNGVNHGNDGVTALAQLSLVPASAHATPTASILADLGGQTLGPGVYDTAVSIGITGPAALTLTGGPNDVFIFQTGDQLQVNPTAQVNLTGGVQPCNVFWQVGSLANLNNSGFGFVGTIIAGTSVTVSNNVTVNGRLLAKTGNVTLINDVINRPTCAAAPPTPAPAMALYCDPTPDANGWTQSYSLQVGQDKLPPYDALGLIPAYIDPVTGAESCNFPPTAPVVTTPTPPPTPTPPTPTVPTPTTPAVTTPTPTTPTVTTPTATTPTPAPTPPTKKVTKGVKAATKTFAKPAVKHAGFTG